MRPLTTVPDILGFGANGPSTMNMKTHFPFFRWIASTLAARWARRTYVVILFSLLLITTAARLRSYFMARKIRAVLHGLADIRLDDESPQYRPRGGQKGLYVIYTADAPSKLTERAFHLKLGCFWSLRGCKDAREIAPALWQDAQAIQAATYQQLISEKCPDSIIGGRMRYLPDITVLLLEVTGSRRIEVNEEGGRTEDWFTDYNLREVIRGHSFGSWKNVRFRPMIPSPDDPT